MAAVVLLVPLGLAAANASTSAPSQPDAGDFDPGYIVSDDTFYNADSMTVDDIQRFLDRQPCIPSGGVPCLADYAETTSDQPDAGADHCASYRGAREETAAQILSRIGRACGINPQVLIVMLQKEQSLVTRPDARGYDRAMGYACPDTADCDTEYFGFFNQVYNAAWQMRQYTKYPTRAFRIGELPVQLSPDAACGAPTVEIRNQATANLYNYTPYQPNEAALANLGDEGDECSSYGNLNFWRLFTLWFGDPQHERFPPWWGGCLGHEHGQSCRSAFEQLTPIRETDGIAP